MSDTDYNVDLSLLGDVSLMEVAIELTARLTIGALAFIIAAAIINWLGITTAVALFVAIAVALKWQVSIDIDDAVSDK